MAPFTSAMSANNANGIRLHVTVPTLQRRPLQQGMHSLQREACAKNFVFVAVVVVAATTTMIDDRVGGNDDCLTGVTVVVVSGGEEGGSDVGETVAVLLVTEREFLTLL